MSINSNEARCTSCHAGYGWRGEGLLIHHLNKHAQTIACNTYLMVPHLFPKAKHDTTAFWKHLDWQKAYTTGMQAAHLPYSGKYKWINTRMYWGIEHEVMPADMALSCVQCHESLKGGRFKKLPMGYKSPYPPSLFPSGMGIRDLSNPGCLFFPWFSRMTVASCRITVGPTLSFSMSQPCCLSPRFSRSRSLTASSIVGGTSSRGFPGAWAHSRSFPIPPPACICRTGPCR